MTFKTLVAASALAAILAVPAFAQPPGGGGGRPQQTPEERAAAFDKADADKNAKLSLAEFKTSLGERAAAMADDQLKGIMDRRDTDKDGSLSKAEYTAPIQRPAQ
jgi:Ca2+-binding EF-hand superfamily protein